MNRLALAITRTLFVLLTATLGFLAIFYFPWVQDDASQSSLYYLNGIKFNSTATFLDFQYAKNMACNYSESYQVNAQYSEENIEFANFFENRNPALNSIAYCNSIQLLPSFCIATEIIIIISQITLIIVVAVASSRIVQSINDASVLVQRLYYIQISCIICSFLSTIAIIVFSLRFKDSFISLPIKWRFVSGFYVTLFTIFTPLLIAVTYWYERKLWSDAFYQDQLRWNRGNEQQRVQQYIEQMQYPRQPSDFQSLMGGLKTPADMTREMDKKEGYRNHKQQLQGPLLPM
ncbi:hypothetical protein cand_015040 [Cryptosporidium andersoni]|uniref:Transmembrane protein n=1 Tax=Cryptosporidium andersoni TaxID=117008 RepID=A0A1J4MU34_9CRYT|nr:hypothetical protein cand_015040 [Cryptosporidium andersoni]